ncbi:phosphoserine aminotransferase [Natranaerovirga hydrolytica]|uniref:Phosphoserine aminotransferase n=1 Tax=Natranaerovirga hydrolytica TaxID=680378 RepID=A0A4V2Q1P6_9FIRM|nr:3-phosphoserine/phosphohydroxythreonine transaminase [Natranaerovirga hydrolytica]TCK98431.1 phosphoserine aminotransferase [Natranaerovirga hydrolytica]
MNRVYNFSAGPATLPEEVLEQASKEMLNYGGTGMSVMEMSHRSKAFDNIIKTAEQDLRDIMEIPDNYKVLFLQGGASLQFAMIPLNLMTDKKKVLMMNTGAWSKKAIAEAKKFGEVVVKASSEESTFNYIPDVDSLDFSEEADYVYITSNNTIYGTRFTKLPEVGDKPLVADMSSNILSEKINVSDYGIIFAGAQKNIGPAGVTIVIIREDLIGKADDSVPTMLNYKTHEKSDSLFNTPPTYSIYIAGLVFKWIKEKGGITAMEKINIEKANILYNYLDESELFSGTAEVKDRSLMNIPFILPTDELNAQFIKEAETKGFVNLKGHRSVGGMRASIYNSMPTEGVEKLVAFMKEFETANKN